MTSFPLIRRGMLLLSLLMAAWTLYQSLHAHRPKEMRRFSIASTVITVGLTAWSVAQFGF